MGTDHEDALTTSDEPGREHETCAACGFDGSRYDDAALLKEIRALGPRWQALLAGAGAGAQLRRRPEEEVWSAIEYAAHSRDVTAMHVVGVVAALEQDEPVVDEIGDEVMEEVARSYAQLDREDVVLALDHHAEELAETAERATPDSWGRGLTVGTVRSDVRRLLEHALHDSTHHLDDVARGFEQLKAKVSAEASAKAAGEK